MGKDKLKRFAEMKTFPNVFQPAFKEIFNASYKLKGQWKSTYFKNENPIVLELGCGRGEYTVGMAKKYPDKNFIGVDIKGARIWRGAKTAVEDNMINVGFIRTKIDFIESFFAKDEVDEIWITFPDPQLKEAKERKRLSGPMFLKRYANLLTKEGTINLKTDSRELYDYTYEKVQELKLPLMDSTNNLYETRQLADDDILNIKTRYELMWLEQGKKICYIRFQLI